MKIIVFNIFIKNNSKKFIKINKMDSFKKDISFVLNRYYHSDEDTKNYIDIHREMITYLYNLLSLYSDYGNTDYHEIDIFPSYFSKCPIRSHINQWISIMPEDLKQHKEEMIKHINTYLIETYKSYEEPPFVLYFSCSMMFLLYLLNVNPKY